MFGLNPYALAAKAGALLLAAMLGAWGGHQVTHNAWEAARAADLQAADDERRAIEQSLAALSEAYEKAKAQKNVEYRTITKTVDRVVDRPVYRNVCLDDDGLRAANAALAGPAAAAGGPDAALPAGDAARGRDGRRGPP